MRPSTAAPQRSIAEMRRNSSPVRRSSFPRLSPSPPINGQPAKNESKDDYSSDFDTSDEKYPKKSETTSTRPGSDSRDHPPPPTTTTNKETTDRPGSATGRDDQPDPSASKVTSTNINPDLLSSNNGDWSDSDSNENPPRHRPDRPMNSNDSDFDTKDRTKDKLVINQTSSTDSIKPGIDSPQWDAPPRTVHSPIVQPRRSTPSLTSSNDSTPEPTIDRERRTSLGTQISLHSN